MFSKMNNLELYKVTLDTIKNYILRFGVKKTVTINISLVESKGLNMMSKKKLINERHLVRRP